MRLGVVEAGRQRARLPVVKLAVLVGVFRFQNARCAGAQKHADAPRAIACLGGRYVFGKAILREADLGETVVAAVEIRQVCAYRRGVSAIHGADPGIEIGAREVARREATSLPAQRIERGVKATSEAACSGEMREQDGFHWMWRRG